MYTHQLFQTLMLLLASSTALAADPPLLTGDVKRVTIETRSGDYLIVPKEPGARRVNLLQFKLEDDGRVPPGSTFGLDLTNKGLHVQCEVQGQLNKFKQYGGVYGVLSDPETMFWVENSTNYLEPCADVLQRGLWIVCGKEEERGAGNPPADCVGQAPGIKPPGLPIVEP